DHLCKIRIVGGPIIHLSLGKSGDLPTPAAVFAAPDPCAVKFTAAPRPKGAGLRISNHVIDWPAVTVRPLNGPAATVITARNQKRALGCADQEGHARRRYQTCAPHPELQSAQYTLGQRGALINPVL